jgi:hypothetical protein
LDSQMHFGQKSPASQMRGPLPPMLKEDDKIVALLIYQVLCRQHLDK